jgi:adenylate cyclase
MEPGVEAAIEWVAALFPPIAARGRRVSVMFTDIEGFTTCAGMRGDRAALALLRRHDRATLPAIRAHRGRLVKRLGDGLMVAFGAPADALAAALAMQRCAQRTDDVRLRIGIHIGAVRLRAGDLVGHDVNVASRIADRAGGGEIVVSERVRRAARTLGVRFRRCRPLVIGATPIPLFRVAPDATQGGRFA